MGKVEENENGTQERQMARPPAVAGQFYEDSRTGLIREIEQCFLGRLGPGKVSPRSEDGAGNLLGLVCPHAGYYYSGSAAAFSYNILASEGIPGSIVLLGPNHYGLGSPVAISPDDVWATPLGEMQVDVETAEAILRSCKFTEVDDLPHAREHSIEVQLPFIQYVGCGSARIVPISIAHLGKADSLSLVEDLGKAIADAVSGNPAVIIASTDFTHYEPKSVAEARDAVAIERILAMDPEGLVEVVSDKDITMCGVVGVAVMMQACKNLGASRAEKLTYYTSGDVSGDTAQVVGYGAIAIRK